MADEVGWPPGGTASGEWRTCAGCKDEIWPSEQVYPAPDASEAVICAVCEVVRVQGAERQAAGRG